MRSRKSHTISNKEVHELALNSLLDAKLLKDHGWLCKATVVLNVVLRAASRMISVCAALRDMADAPSDQAVFTALTEGLPKTLPVLEKRLNMALTGYLPRGVRRHAREVAIDFHLVPYYGTPHKSRNELYYGQPKSGTKHFHAYASACIVEYGVRYTVALTWVRRHESMVKVLGRLLEQMRKIELKTKCLLLDRAFFNIAVVAFLQQEQMPFLMPVMFRGRRPKKPAKKGLHWIKRQSAGWYKHVLKHGKKEVSISVCVGYRRHRNRKDRKQVKQKLLFGAWRIKGSPTEIRERYRKRFGIETSYRQLRQARIYTCVKDPHVRFFFIAVALILRNLWIWIHETYLAEGAGESKTLRLDLLRFKRMLDWIAQAVVAELHDGSIPYVECDT
jgi:hypothetical protein